VLLGNSIGGAVSIRLASQHPKRVKAIVLCDSGGLGPPGLVGQIFIVQFFAAGRRGAFWYPWAFARYYRKVLLKPAAQEERERIIRSACEIAPTLEQAWRSFGRPEENLAPLLRQIPCPVLLAWAKDDFVVSVKRSALSFQAFPNHRLQVFEGGHPAFLEDPDNFEQALRGFLNQVCPV
jgi:pimeloyl-ACP methyl ester carboxylesterase